MLDNEHLGRLTLKQYDFNNPTLKFIRHNENLTYMVTDGNNGKCYLLRIHLPIDSFPKDVRYTYAGLKSEMMFIENIYEHTDVAVQRPCVNNSGDIVTLLDEENQSEPICCTVLSWIPGETMSHEDPDWGKQAFHTGVMVAKLHIFAKWWTPTVTLDRPTYGAAFLQSMIDRIKHGVDIRLISEKQYCLLREAAKFIALRMKELDQHSGTYGIIHADLQKTNLVVNDNQ